MKKRIILMVALALAAALVVLGVLYGPVMWFIAFGSEDVSGPQGGIPEAAMFLPPITTGPADWPQWRGPTLDGRSAATGIRTDWAGGLRKLWEVDYLCQGKDASTWSSPVVAGNRLVVPGRDATSDLVFCLEADTGKLLWLGSYEAEADNTHGPGARATPAIDGDRVYTFGRSGDLACWRLLDGKLLWKVNVADAGGSEPKWGHSSAPLIHGGKVVVQGGGDALVAAYDKMSGEPAWKSMTGDAGYAACVPAGQGPGAMLLVFHGTGLACVDAGGGQQLWSIPWVTDYGVNATTPAVVGDVVFITSGYETGGQAMKVTRQGSRRLWRNKDYASHHSDPLIVDGHIYGYSGFSHQNKGDFMCLALDTGREKWRTGELGWGTALAVDGHLLCLDIKGNLFLVKPDPKRLVKVAEFRGGLGRPKHPAWTMPVVANGKLYLRYRQRLICYDLVSP